MKILVADDDTFFLKVVSEILNDAGHDAVLAKSGEEALEKAITEHPDLIILDIVLPRLLGTEVCESLRELKMTAHIPILLVSARVDSMEELVWKPTDFPADDFLRKPFPAEELLDRIDRLSR